MSIEFIQYPKCSTCRKAKKWLEEKGVAVKDRHIAEEKPTQEELSLWIAKSGLPVRKFFNTSGQLYRQMGLKEKLETMTEEEQIALLASDGMLVKRPLLISEDFVLVGFKEDQWEEKRK